MMSYSSCLAGVRMAIRVPDTLLCCIKLRGTTSQSSSTILTYRRLNLTGLAMHISGVQQKADDKPSPWRFIRWRKANESQSFAFVGKKCEEKKGNFVYKVVPGETLADIAAKFNTYVEVLMEANKILNPDNIAAGQLLWIPQTYKIAKGDTLYSLSHKFGVKISSIQAANGIEDPNLIFAGDIILIPEEAETEEVGMLS